MKIWKICCPPTAGVSLAKIDVTLMAHRCQIAVTLR
jgi:hypothetical protein